MHQPLVNFAAFERRGHVHHGFHLVLARSSAVPPDLVAQVFHLWFKQLTLVTGDCHAVRTDSLEHTSEVLDVLFHRLAVDQYVVHVHARVILERVAQDRVHASVKMLGRQTSPNEATLY